MIEANQPTVTSAKDGGDATRAGSLSGRNVRRQAAARCPMQGSAHA